MKSLLWLPRIKQTIAIGQLEPLESGSKDNILSVITTGQVGFRDRFREYLRDVEKDNKNASHSEPDARHFNPPNHSMQQMAVCASPYIKEAQKAAKL